MELKALQSVTSPKVLSMVSLSKVDLMTCLWADRALRSSWRNSDKENIMNKLTMNAVVLLLSMLSVVPLFAETAQEELEFYLQDGNWHVDNITSESSFPPYVPHRYRNSLPQFEGFIARHAWTTNQFIEGLICAITNNITDEKCLPLQSKHNHHYRFLLH